VAVVDGYFFDYGVCGYVEFEVFYRMVDGVLSLLLFLPCIGLLLMA